MQRGSSHGAAAVPSPLRGAHAGSSHAAARVPAAEAAAPVEAGEAMWGDCGIRVYHRRGGTPCTSTGSSTDSARGSTVASSSSSAGASARGGNAATPSPRSGAFQGSTPTKATNRTAECCMSTSAAPVSHGRAAEGQGGRAGAATRSQPVAKALRTTAPSSSARGTRAATRRAQTSPGT